MSEFKIIKMPGGEIVLGRELTVEKDGVEDWDQFMLRRNDQEKLIKWLWENCPYEMEFGR